MQHHLDVIPAALAALRGTCLWGWVDCHPPGKPFFDCAGVFDGTNIFHFIVYPALLPGAGLGHDLDLGRGANSPSPARARVPWLYRQKK